MDEVSAALADVQARQQSLARGAVLPRVSAPPAAVHDAAAAPPSSPPAAKSKPRPPAFQWLKRRVVRRSERKDSALEDLGSLELVSSASLATARALVGQFIALPPRREFQFVHPTTNAPVATAHEKDVLAADWPFICIVLLPLREAAAREQRWRQRPETAHPQQPQQQTKPPPWTPELGAATRPRTAAAAAVAPAKRASPEVAGSAREQQTVRVRTKDMEKDAAVDSKRDKVPLEVVEAKTVDGEEALFTDSSAGQLKPNRYQVKSTAVNSTVASVPRGRRTATRLPSAASTNASNSAASSEAESTSPTVGDAAVPPADVKGMKEGEAHVLDAMPFSSAQDYQEETHGDDSQETTSSDAVTLESVHETPSLPERLISQTPGHLRRSRRFKTLTAANIAKKSWGSEQLEQQQVVSDEQVEELVLSLVEIFRTGMTEVETRQLDAALLYYGIGYRALELNGLLLALDAELGTRCNHVQNGVDGQLMQVLLKIFPVERENGIDLEALQRFEYALNLFAGMRGWKSPTKLRACCFEDRQPLQLIPVIDSRRLSLLRLSDKDRQLFGLASSNNSTAGIEKWLADGLEVTYILLYGFLQSRRNAGPKSLAKLDNLHMRQDRIQAAIQKLSCFSFDVWKRLEFRTTDVEDVFMVKRLNELVSGFLRDANLYSRELDGTVFFPAIVGYLTRKSEQLAQSLSGLLVSTRGSRESLHNTVKEYLSSIRQQLEQHKLHSASPDIYLSTIGLKIVDVDKINASRSSAGLGRIYMNGKESILTHHQCKLMARDRSLRVRGRWEQHELNKGEVSRYFFVGPKDVALEYIYLRAKAAPSGGDEMHWEDNEAFAKKEAQHAFAFFCSMSTVVPMNVAIGIGINIVHSDLLPHLCSLLSLSVVLREYSDATSVSFGYCYESVIQATRVVFRVHTEMSAGNQSYDRGAGVWWGLPSAIRRAGQFLMSAQEEEVIAFCKAEGLNFLHSLLEGRGLPWHFVKFGQPFSDYILGTCGRDPECLREDVLRAIQATITKFPRAPQCITKTNIQIIVQLVEMLPGTSDIGDDAVNVLQALCSNVQQPKFNGISGAFSAAMMTEPQKTFATQCGLEILVNATTRLQHMPARKESVEYAIVALLMTYELSATKSGLLTHWREYLEFYVGKKAWEIYPGTPRFAVFLLQQIHAQFFTISSFVEPETETCHCGCNKHLETITDACVGVMTIFVKLITTDAGVMWAQEEMQGPRDCVLFLLWSVQQNHWIPAMTKLHDLFFQTLWELLERMTSPHQYLRLLSELTSPLLELLQQKSHVSLHTGTLRVLSFTFRLAVDKKVWLISMETFLAAFYQILESFCDDPSLSSMNSTMVDVLFHSEYHRRDPSRKLFLLHEEHVNFVGGSGQLSPVARSRTKSLMQTLVSFCSLTWNSALQPVCQIPALIALGWILTSLEVATELEKLEVDEVLLTLLEHESAAVSILASRAYVVLLFQGLLSRRIIDEYRLKRLCNLLTTILASGSRLMISPKRSSSNPETPETIHFAANMQDSFSILRRYRTMNNEQQVHARQKELDQEDAPLEGRSPDEVIWESSEWNDPNRAVAEKLATHLKILVVFSSMTKNVVSIGGSDELREIILLLVRFDRERLHSTSYHTTLYLLSLRNILWATRLDVAKWGISDLMEASFLRKLLLLAKDKIYQELASGILWGLADAYEKSNTFILSFEVDDAVATGSYFTKKKGFAVMVDNLASKLASGRSVENDAGALASMIANPASSSFFLTNYGYPFVLKLIESMLRLVRAGYTIGPKVEEPSQSAGEVFGTTLFYLYPIKHRIERELFQLCRAAANVLEAMQRINPESVLDEAARTKLTMLQLLDYPNKQIAFFAVSCCSIHLQTHPTKTKLLEAGVQDKVIAFFFDDAYPPIQIAAFSCMKLAFADQKNFAGLQLQLSPLIKRIVACLRSPNFEVKRKVILFLVEAVFRLDDQNFLDGVADAFGSQNNKELIMELFESVSREIAGNPSAGSVLQLLVRLILKLNLVHTGGDQLVDVICLTLKVHSNDTFLRPMLFNFLHQIVTQGDRVYYLERRSRLDVITGLLSQQLTQNELRNVANMLFLAANNHAGIRHYLSGFTSKCIPKIVSVMDGFSEYVQDNDASKILQHQSKEEDSEENPNEEQTAQVPDADAANYYLKVTTAKTVFISYFIEDIYEQFLRLLLLLVTGSEFCSEERYGCPCEGDGCPNCDPCDIVAKALCGHVILRLSTADRILCSSYDISYLISAKGDPATSVLHLSIRILEVLAANHQSRGQLLRGSVALEWSWIPLLTRSAILSGHRADDADVDDTSSTTASTAAQTIQMFGHLSAAKEFALRLAVEKPFIAILFSYLDPTDMLFTSNVEVRRASSFTLARLAEYPLIVRDTFFQEKMAMLAHAALDYGELQVSSAEHDPLVLANKMILTRNRALLTPGLQGRSADDDILSLLMRLLLSDEVDSNDVGALCADVLAHVLYFRVNACDEKRLRSVMWRYTRAMSPDKSADLFNYPSSKRLTAYLHNWLEPMLQKLRQSNFGELHGDSAKLLSDELASTCKHLEEPSISELLRVLISLHLRPFSGDISERVVTNNVIEAADVDIIAPYKCENLYPPRPRYLQYIFMGYDRSSREPNDFSFCGSAHLWYFLRKLWELANDGEICNEQAQIARSMVKDIVASSIPGILRAWSDGSRTRYSTVAFDRRKSFLDFVIAVGKVKPEIFNAVDVKLVVDVVANTSSCSGATMGREYLLLHHTCSHIPTKLDSMIQCINLDQDGGREPSPSEMFRLFWSPVQLEFHPVKFVLPPNTRMTILDPSPDVEPSTIFGVDLLWLISSHVPTGALWYVQCHGYTQLLDMIVLGAKVSALQMQQLIVRTFVSNLLHLMNQLMEVESAKYLRIFASDPRYLRCIVDLIYAPAHEVQSTAIKLLQILAQHPRIFAMLSHLEDLVQPVSSVNSDMLSYVTETIVVKHQLSLPMLQDSVVLLAHLIFVPFFTGLSTTELVKLSLGFDRCNEYSRRRWLILVKDCRFSAIPEWMFEPNNSTVASFASAMKRIQKRFEISLGVQRDKSNVSLYSIDKDSYISHTSAATRKRIALKLDNLLKMYTDDSKMYRGSVRARNGIVMRLGRLLVEDRAEIIRRVAYTKRVSERILFEQMRSQQLSDLMLLLEENPLFEGIQRDLLANLAFRMRSPAEIEIENTSSMKKLPLLLVYNESVEFEMHIPGAQEIFRGTVLRGGLLGFPPWAQHASSPAGAEGCTTVRACGLLGAVIPMEVLESELPEPVLKLVNDRLREAYGASDIEAISFLMGISTLPVLKSGKRRLQRSAMSLIVRLISADAFIDSLLNDEWAIEVIVDVALGALPCAVVLDALTVVAAMTANEAYTKRFCAKLPTSENGHPPDQTKDATTGLLRPVVSILNRFKVRLWQDYPAILEKFFLIQTQLASYLREFWPNLEKIWPSSYLKSCLALLHSDYKGTTEVVGYHLSSAIPYRLDYLMLCGYNLGLHLALAQVLARARHGNIVGMLKLFDAFCSDDLLREEIWERVVTSSEKFNGVLEHVSSAIDECFEAGDTKDVEVYCRFLYLLCMSGICEERDLEFRCSIENRFGMLSKLILRLRDSSEKEVTPVLLQCIGSICIDIPSHCNIATTLAFTFEEQQLSLCSTVTKSLSELGNCLAGNGEAVLSVIEGVFLCIDSIISAVNQVEFEAQDVVSTAVRAVEFLTSSAQALRTESVAALQSVINTLLRALASDYRHYNEAFHDESDVSVLLAGYERVSKEFSNTNDDLALMKLLGRYTTLINELLSCRHFVELVWTTYFSNSQKKHSFVAWLYHWMVFEASDSPPVRALKSSRAIKHDRLLGTAARLKGTTFAVMIKLSEHDSISEVANLHPGFATVLTYIFAELRNESRPFDLAQATSWMHFLCVVGEQWSEDTRMNRWQTTQHYLSMIRAFLPNISVAGLIKACSSVEATEDTFKCFAIRFLLLTVKLRGHFAKLLADSVHDEWHELFPLSSNILKSPTSLKLTKCYVTSLLAELAFNGGLVTSFMQSPTQLVDLVRAVLEVYDRRVTQATWHSIASGISDDFLSSRKWCGTDGKANLDGFDTTLHFALIRESLRLILYLLRELKTRIALFNAEFFHPLLCGTIFQEAISFLSVSEHAEPWIGTQINALQLIKSLMGSGEGADGVSAPLQTIRTYQFSARRGQIVKHCTKLLLKPYTDDFRRTIVESLIPYVSQNISASNEVAALREHGEGDLMEALLAMATQEYSESPQGIVQLCLQLYNSIIEFSVINATYAAQPSNMERLRKIREESLKQDALVSSCLPQTLFHIVRIIGRSKQSTDRGIVEEIWEVTSGVLLHPKCSLHLNPMKHSLEILCCSGAIRRELLASVAHDWEDRGKRVVLRLTELTHCNSPVAEGTTAELDASIATLSMKAIAQMCHSDTLCERMSRDLNIGGVVLMDSTHQLCKYRAQVLKALLAYEITANRTSQLAEQLLSQLNDILVMKSECRLQLLELLPSLSQSPAFEVTDLSDSIWNVFRCILAEADYGKHSPRSLVTAVTGLVTLLDVYDASNMPSELFFDLQDSLKRLLSEGCSSNDKTGSCGIQLNRISKLELLVLASLDKLSGCVGEGKVFAEQYSAQFFSLWMDSSTSHHCSVDNELKTLLQNSLALHFLDADVKADPLTTVVNFRPYWRVLARMFVSLQDTKAHFIVSTMLLQMLQSPSGRDFRRFVADTYKLNLIDVLWWEVFTVNQDVETENREFRALWYALLNELCCSRVVAVDIMSKRFLEEFILYECRYQHQLEDERLRQLFCLVSSVIRVTSTSDHGQFFAKDHATMEILAELCIRTIVSISDMNEPKWNATEVLRALIMHEQTLIAVRKVCYLYPMEQSDYDSIARRSRLLAISEMLLQCENAIADLVCVLTLVLKICGSKQGIPMLVHARNAPDCWPMTDVLVEVLQQCIGSATDSAASANRYLRPIVLTTTRPDDFLPYELPTELHTQATVLALRLVHLCVGDYHLAQSLETDMELVPQLVACLASSTWEVAGAAAAVLSTLIRCAPDWNDSLDNNFASVTRYMCDQGVYRWLDYFSTMDTQVTCRLSHPSMFPSCFVLLLRWLRFYSVNLSLLSDFQPVEFKPGESYALLPRPNSSDLHVKLVEDILELLLYIVSNFHSEIYKNDNSEADESEHAIFLQSLLALCQRRSQSQPGAQLGSENDTCTVSSSQIRSRSLELVQLLCSLDLPHTSSVEVFANSRQMLILMMMVERSASEIEQSAAAQLIEELALKDVIKDLLIRNTSLLSRLGAWLEIEALQLLAAAIFRRLATPSSKGSRSARQSVFGFSPSAQQQLAHFLFVGLGQPSKNLDDLPSHSALLLKDVRRINVAVTQQEENGRSSPMDSSLVVHLKFEIILQRGLCIREFEYNVKFRSGSGSSRHEFLAEQPVSMIRCTVTACSLVGIDDFTESKFELVPGFGSFVHYCDFVTLRVSENPSAQSPSTRGVLSRLLRQETDALSLPLFDALSSIVTEFCKDFSIFCDPVIDLPKQILFVLAISATFSPDGKMDTACLEALCTWFPSKPTISSLKSSVSPLLRLIQSLRQLPCIGDDVVGVKQIIPRDNYVPTSTQYTFLETFVEFIASVEAGEYSANCLNILFMENSDLLLYLCAQFKPMQSSHATFLALVSIAIRREVVHCQSFTTRSAQNLLRSVFDAGIRQSVGQSEQEQGEFICFAASVAVRLARCPGIDRNSVNGADSLQYFSRVAFELFARHQWADCFPTEARKDLIVACGFFCDGLLKSVAVDADTRESGRYAALFTAFDVPDDGLTIVETLLMFLGQPSTNDQGTGDGQVAFDSIDRLAASVLASLVEKLPSRAKLEQTLLQLLDRRSNNLDSPQINGKHFEEQCLTGMRKCIGLTRYDFQSELHAVQLTYYSCIRAGVRTGIIPPQCSGVFQHFDQEHLLPTESGQWHLDQMGLADQMRRRHSHLYRSSDENPVTWSSKSVAAEDARLDSELRELILYANEHAELLSVLTVNRKKAMTTAIRAATRNARVLMAFHATTSIALDFYVDTAKKLQHQREGTERGGKTNDHRSHRLSRSATLDTAHQTTFLEWLLLLEELAGLLCAGLHELDAMYYTDIARQFRSLILDLPLFLRKIQRLGTHSRQQALMLFLDNLHRLLKRATNRNELRVVAANGSGIVDQTKGIRARLRDLDVPISTSLGTLLESPHGMENLSRTLVAMQYIWRRIMGTTALEKAMTSSKESISLLKKITEKLVKFLHILQCPMMAFQAGFGSQRQSRLTEEFDSPSAVLNTPQTVDSVITDQSQSSNGREALALPGKTTELLWSRFPFISSELLLDHFGWECLGAKRAKQLVRSPKHASAATEVLRSAFGADRETVERMSILELAEHFHHLEGAKTLFDVLDQLRQLPLDDELPFSQLPYVAHDRMEMSLWQLMVRPIQRVRLFHLHQQMQRFVASDYGKRQVLLNRYRLASPHRPAMTSASRDQFDFQGANATKFRTKSRESSVCTRICTMPFQSEQRIAADRSVHKPPVPPAPVDGPSTSSPSPKVIISESTLKVCDGILSPDPFSDDAAMILLRRKLEAQKRRRSSSLFRVWQTGSSRSAMYRNDSQEGGLVDRVFRWFVSLGARLMLLIAFWRQEELRTDLQDPIMARAFDDTPERDEYYRLYHAKKGLGELVRVWMPTSGRLGLLLWQERYYALGGTMLSIAIALWLPSLVFPDSDTDATSSDALSRNTVMTRIVYTYGVGIFLLSVVSIVRIARNRFVLLEQTRLRLRPVSRYYQNVLAVISIAVELVQLNSLAFDSAVEWDDTDQLPAVLQWLGNQGITKFGVSSVSELQALGVLLLLLLWFLLLKCANKFQETSALLHRVLTKDLPALVHGFLYMGTISVFFSYLACMDCADKHSSGFSKCQSEPQTPPFLIAHQNVKCWTPAHRWYALLGMWGITFFLPIGLLAHGMSHVLFQRETLDIKYAPVLLLVAQLVKAGAATAQAFFPYDPMLLAILGVIGNGVLLVLTLAMQSCSLWYIKYVKCGIYAASCWASLGAIHRLHYAGQSSTRSLNMIYFGWLSIGLVTAAAILLRVWLRAQAKYRDAERHFAAQQRLLSAGKSTGEIGAVELKFLKAVQKRSRDDVVRAAFIENAKKLSTSAPPSALKEFVARAEELLEGSSSIDSVRGAQFMRSAQVSAKKLQTLRRRR